MVRASGFDGRISYIYRFKRLYLLIHDDWPFIDVYQTIYKETGQNLWGTLTGISNKWPGLAKTFFIILLTFKDLGFIFKKATFEVKK